MASSFMRALQNLRVKDKITAITLLAILVVTLLSSAVFVTIESRGAKRAIVQELKTIAGIIADNTGDKRVISLTRTFANEADCVAVVDEFCQSAGGIDALVVLSGGIYFSGHWKDMPADDWEKDIALNLNQPFYLARAVMERMKGQGGGGRILLTGTESALHGGSPQSFTYAIAKRGTECMIQGLAREGAPLGVLVNGVRFGYIASGFHQRWHGKTETEMSERADMVPLKRGGHPDEAAALMIYLLSDWAGFITGQMIPLTGGDWL